MGVLQHFLLLLKTVLLSSSLSLYGRHRPLRYLVDVRAITRVVILHLPLPAIDVRCSTFAPLDLKFMLLSSSILSRSVLIDSLLFFGGGSEGNDVL